jgi:hypothetical protein
MKRIFVIAACGTSLAACSAMPDFMQFDVPKPAPAATTMQFESEPAGAEARTSHGQTCRTPCSVAVSSNEFTVSFSLPGYQAQTIPVRVVAPTESRDIGSEGESAPPRLVPNPVFVELQPLPAPPQAARRAAPPAKPKPKPAARPAPTASVAPAAPPPPEAAPASPWPPPSR